MMDRLPLGECTICGAQARLPHQCPRCKKGGCEKDDCAKHIRRVDQCRVSARGQQYAE